MSGFFVYNHFTFKFSQVLFNKKTSEIIMENENKKAAGRPFKMENWLSELKVVLETEDILFLSDDDLRFLVNERLPDGQGISDRTLENWKHGRYHQDEKLGKEFLHYIHKALIRQKQFLSQKMLADEKNWQKIAWIMERKFTEWNLKHISENINRNEQSTTINITTGSEEQRRLIDSIINTDFEIIEPLRIENSEDNKEDEDYEF